MFSASCLFCLAKKGMWSLKVDFLYVTDIQLRPKKILQAYNCLCIRLALFLVSQNQIQRWLFLSTFRNIWEKIMGNSSTNVMDCCGAKLKGREGSIKTGSLCCPQLKSFATFVNDVVLWIHLSLHCFNDLRLSDHQLSVILLTCLSGI